MSIDKTEYQRAYQKAHAKEHTERQLRYLRRRREADPEGYRVSERERNRQYYQKNREQVVVYYRKYRLKHREQLVIYYRKYRLNHREQCAAYQRKWRLKHREQLVVYYRKYRLNHREQIAIYKRKYRLKHRSEEKEMRRNETKRDGFEKIEPEAAGPHQGPLRRPGD
jgi:hypothetical protein